MQLRRRTVTAVGEGMAAPTSPRVAIKSTASTSARKSKVAAEPRPFLEEVSRKSRKGSRAIALALKVTFLRQFIVEVH
jgi:hypothetical protein